MAGTGVFTFNCLGGCGTGLRAAEYPSKLEHGLCGACAERARDPATREAMRVRAEGSGRLLSEAPGQDSLFYEHT